MLDIIDFVAERGGNPKAIKESQERRYAPQEVVDEVYEMYEDHRRSNGPQICISFKITDILASQLSTQPAKLEPKSMPFRKRLG